MAGTTHHHQEPEAERRSFRLTMVLILVLILVATAALALVLVLRDDDSDSGSGTSNTTSASAAPTTPEGYAQALYAAWKAGDRSAAAQVASPEAVNQIFQFAYEPIQTNAGPQDPYQFRGCEGAAGSTFCTWAGQDTAQIVEQVRNDTGGLPILVVGVQRQGG
jgi:flagellar basal body-associated protein FliL